MSSDLFVKAEMDYRREYLSRIYPKKRRQAPEAIAVLDGKPRRSVFRLRKVWSG